MIETKVTFKFERPEQVQIIRALNISKRRWNDVSRKMADATVVKVSDDYSHLDSEEMKLIYIALKDQGFQYANQGFKDLANRSFNIAMQITEAMNL